MKQAFSSETTILRTLPCTSSEQESKLGLLANLFEKQIASKKFSFIERLHARHKPNQMMDHVIFGSALQHMRSRFSDNVHCINRVHHLA